jgi:PAS domain S-box-containing protein
MNAMGSETRILHLEDDPADAELVEARLRAEGLQCSITRVDTRDAFENELCQRVFDVVFADYQLPSYDGVSALRFTHDRFPDLPFIVVSGTLGEDAAIECLTRGATDYVTKQKLVRLGPVTRRAISEAENRRARKRAEKEVELLSFALNHVGEAAFLVDENARFQFVNEEACRVLGYTRTELLGLTVHDIDPDFQLSVWIRHWDQLKSNGSLTFESRHQAKDGSVLFVEVNANYLIYDGKAFNLALVRNITERRRAEETVQKLSHVVEQSPVSVIVTDTTGTIEYVNPKFTAVTGYPSNEALGKNPRILKSGMQGPEVYADLWSRLLSGKDWRGELCNRRKDGSIYWELAVISPMVDARGRTTNYIAVKEDITARKTMEDHIRASLHEKEILLKEVHHRVKNNLQIISSLLELQAAKHTDQTIHDAFGESQRRVRTMALVHEQLYGTDDLARIDFGRHLSQIAHELLAVYGRTGIALEVNVESILFPVDLAIPCGLIANELLTNALKHAFVGRESGTIEVTLRMTDLEHAELVIADNGVGFVVEQNPNEVTSLGMKLVWTLVEQISAVCNTETSRGAKFIFRIPVGESSSSV